MPSKMIENMFRFNSRFKKHRHMIHSETTSRIRFPSADNLATSGFLSTLPIDVRNLIYEELLLETSESLIWHLIPVNKTKGNGKDKRWKRTCQPCITGEAALGYDHYLGWGNLHQDCRTALTEPNEKQYIETYGLSSLLNVLLTCRQLYYEASEILFTTITFNFEGLDALAGFLESTPICWVNQIRAIQLCWTIQTPMYFQESFFHPETGGANEIQSSRVKYAREYEVLWQATCSRLAKLEHLLNLEVVFYDAAFQIEERLLLAPLVGIKLKRVFVVQVPWVYAEGSLECEADFVLMRPRLEESHTISFAITRGGSRSLRRQLAVRFTDWIAGR